MKHNKDLNYLLVCTQQISLRWIFSIFLSGLCDAFIFFVSLSIHILGCYLHSLINAFSNITFPSL